MAVAPLDPLACVWKSPRACVSWRLRHCLLERQLTSSAPSPLPFADICGDQMLNLRQALQAGEAIVVMSSMYTVKINLQLLQTLDFGNGSNKPWFSVQGKQIDGNHDQGCCQGSSLALPIKAGGLHSVLCKVWPHGQQKAYSRLLMSRGAT